MKKENVLVIGGRGYLGSEIVEQIKDEFNTILVSGVDVTNKEEVDLFFKKNELPIDHVIYSVGLPLDFNRLEDESCENFTKHFNTQVIGLFFVIKNILRSDSLKSIVIIGSSVLFGNPIARLSSYNTSKYALYGFFKSIYGELSPKNIRINMISPGLIGEGLSRDFPDVLLEFTKTQTPLKRLVNSKDVAYLTKFLLSKDAEYITGLNIPLDGGMHIC